jgi:hypothetical protein
LGNAFPGTAESNRRTVTVLNVVVVLGLGICCFPISLLLMPNVEQPRSQARLAQAYNDVRRLHDDLHEIPPDRRETQEVDPWGQPYRIVFVDAAVVRVMSLGPNQVSPESTFDTDDIYSDMSTSPTASYERRTRFRLSVAVGAAVSVWLLLSAACLRFRQGKS